MTKPPSRQDSLRAYAEVRLDCAATTTPMRPAEELLHELQMHRIELEMQNEELRRVRTALEESRDRYVDMYDFSPVGHFTLSDTGMITEVNLTRDLSPAINISARQFQQPGMVDEVRQVLAETGADPSRLKFELTKRLVFANVADTIAKMEALGQLGIGFSMDDFGAGYSSLSSLKRLPLEQLKIDRSFVDDLTRGGNDAAIVRTIIAMGETLGLKVIAEGVETEAQLECLDQYHCASFQGYVFSRPVPLVEFEKLALCDS